MNYSTRQILDATDMEYGGDSSDLLDAHVIYDNCGDVVAAYYQIESRRDGVDIYSNAEEALYILFSVISDTKSIIGDHIKALPTRAYLAVMAELANYWAKMSLYRDLNVTAEDFYWCKVVLAAAAIKAGCKFWMVESEEDYPLWYLYDKTIGVVSFHDPKGNLAEEVESTVPPCRGSFRSFPWSRVYRQFEILSILEHENALNAMVLWTRPRNLANPYAWKSLEEDLDIAV